MWTDEELFEALEVRYGLDAVHADPQQSAAGTVMSWHVACEDAPDVRVTQYLDWQGLQDAAHALDMSEYCRAAGLSVPRVHADKAGWLLSDGATSGVCSVTDVPGGAPFLRPYTRDQAQHLGVGLGRMHRALASYPLPSAEPRHDESAWAVLSVEDAVTSHEAAALAAVTRGVRDAHISGQLQWIRQCLTEHLGELREATPDRGTLTAYAIHGAFIPPYIRSSSARPVVTGFRARYGYLAWETARAAFDVRTVAQGDGWQECAVSLLAAYHSTHPDLPLREISACPRIALLELLCAPLPTAVLEAWELRSAAVRQLLEALPVLDKALARLGAQPRRQV
ncbi:hypothetical protein [Streptomyces sp. BE230]|uniref:hypothetical protein n=1 Tax=Streptomyces sp. BE230 TaxID=3002526 RepID=UPI002ED561D3|nr:hypothetical protein [Streptomyces sp. BE230]